MFYMHDAYGIPIRAQLARTLERWNREDPVSDEERRRNDLIERLQGNRNPFIDDPARADALRF
jgi:deoxyribonuclease-1